MQAWCNLSDSDEGADEDGNDKGDGRVKGLGIPQKKSDDQVVTKMCFA